MRFSPFLLAAAAHLASADGPLGQMPEGRGGRLQPRETEASTHDSAKGWTPRPTEGPGTGGRANALELVRRGEAWFGARRDASETSNTWLNENTCGYTAGISCESLPPGVLRASLTIIHNSGPFHLRRQGHLRDQLRGRRLLLLRGRNEPLLHRLLGLRSLGTGTLQEHGAEDGLLVSSLINAVGLPCVNIASASSTASACITYLWPGTEPKSMYRCYSRQTLVTMLNEPQFVIDDRTKTTSSPSSSSTPSSTTSESPPAQSTTSTPPPVSGGSSNNTGAIVGGVVGGVAGIALIAGAAAFLAIRKRNKKTDGGSPQTYSAVAAADSSYQGGGSGSGGLAVPPGAYPPGAPAHMSQTGYFPPGSVGSTLGPGTGAPYLNSTTPPTPAVYDEQQSYYAPPKTAEQQQHYAPYPGGAPQGYPLPPQQQHQQQQQQHQQHFVSELDTSNVMAGQQGNPVEMPVNPPAPR